MSDIGRSSSIYLQTRGWAEDLDEVLISLKSRNIPDQQLSENVGNLLLNLSDETFQKEQTRFIVLQLRQKIDVPKNKLKSAGEKLIANSFSDNVVQVLEQVALALEQEQSSAMTRMHRWAR